MSTIDEIKKAGQEVTDKLVKIREGIGASLQEGEFEPGGYIMIPGTEILERAQKTPNEPIIINDECFRAYIRDHSHYEWTQDLMETDCFTNGRKVHFYYCSTLQEMTDIGRLQKYHLQNLAGNQYVIDFKNRKNVKLRLAWCLNCLQVMESKSQINLTWPERRVVVSRGDAEECIDCVEALYNGKEPFNVIQQKVKNFFKTQ